MHLRVPLCLDPLETRFLAEGAGHIQISKGVPKILGSFPKRDEAEMVTSVWQPTAFQKWDTMQ